jgi:hypothetical protein
VIVPLLWDKPPLTANQIRKMHHMAEASTKAVMLTQAIWSISQLDLTRRTYDRAVVVLHWRMGDKRRRDGDGAAPTLKVCLDALVQEGIVPDDSWQYVVHSGITTHAPVPGKPGAMWLSISSPDEEMP